jgi:hypothetical protein
MFRWLGIRYSRTDTPFLGSVVIGSLTATVATLGDVTWLLVTGASARIAFDLTICVSALLVHYGVGLPQCRRDPNNPDEAGKSSKNGTGRHGQRRRRQRRKHHK